MNIRQLHNLLFGVFILLNVIIAFDPHTYREDLTLYSDIIGLPLILGSLIFTFFDTKHKNFRSAKDIRSENNTPNWVQLWFLLFISRLDTIPNLGTLLYITLCLLLTSILVIVILRDYIKDRTVYSSVIGFIFFISCLLAWSRIEYSNHFGTKESGSFFEPIDYRTTFRIGIRETSSKSDYSEGQASVHVFSDFEQEEDDDGNYRTFESRRRTIDSVFLLNGDTMFMSGCDLENTGSSYCLDNEMVMWEVILIDEKTE